MPSPMGVCSLGSACGASFWFMTLAKSKAAGRKGAYTLIPAAVNPNSGRPSATKAEMGLVIFSGNQTGGGEIDITWTE